jgi:hypothetical protein
MENIVLGRTVSLVADPTQDAETASAARSTTSTAMTG